MCQLAVIKEWIPDPKILLTTSHDPSSRLSQFVKELKLIFPNCQRLNRGKTQIKELMDAGELSNPTRLRHGCLYFDLIARANEVTDVILVHEHRGNPDGMIVSHMPYGPTAYFGLSGVILRHDIQVILAFHHAIQD